MAANARGLVPEASLGYGLGVAFLAWAGDVACVDDALPISHGLGFVPYDDFAVDLAKRGDRRTSFSVPAARERFLVGNSSSRFVGEANNPGRGFPREALLPGVYDQDDRWARSCMPKSACRWSTLSKWLHGHLARPDDALCAGAGAADHPVYGSHGGVVCAFAERASLLARRGTTGGVRREAMAAAFRLFASHLLGQPAPEALASVPGELALPCACAAGAETVVLRDGGARVLVLDREDLVASYVSMRVAREGRSFHCRGEAGCSSANVTVDVADLVREVRHRVASVADRDAWVASLGLEATRLTYEACVADPEACYATALEFLDVESSQDIVARLLAESPMERSSRTVARGEPRVPRRLPSTDAALEVRSALGGVCDGATFAFRSGGGDAHRRRALRRAPAWESFDVGEEAAGAYALDRHPKHASPYNHLRFYAPALAEYDDGVLDVPHLGYAVADGVPARLLARLRKAAEAVGARWAGDPERELRTWKAWNFGYSVVDVAAWRRRDVTGSYLRPWTAASPFRDVYAETEALGAVAELDAPAPEERRLSSFEAYTLAPTAAPTVAPSESTISFAYSVTVQSVSNYTSAQAYCDGYTDLGVKALDEPAELGAVDGALCGAQRISDASADHATLGSAHRRAFADAVFHAQRSSVVAAFGRAISEPFVDSQRSSVVAAFGRAVSEPLIGAIVGPIARANHKRALGRAKSVAELVSHNERAVVAAVAGPCRSRRQLVRRRRRRADAVAHAIA
ncbi:hypothetical protein JL721_9977 [Aureococcus anophagefferens]|nr:hypothetical protein JL721_9977 [Aureococcus anophagefferens]